MRKKFTLVASLAFAAALCAGVGAANVQADAAENYSGFAITATSVRYDDTTKEGVDSGLRFKVDVPTGVTVTNAYTKVTLTPKSGDYAGQSVTSTVLATVWRPESLNQGYGWNTVLLGIPAADYATEITAQAFATINGVEYETAAVTSSIAKTASEVMNSKNAMEDALNVYVNNVESITLDNETLTVEQGASAKLTATIAPEDYKVVWTSDNTEVATVDNTGKVTTKKAGTANITAQMGDKSATCAVTATESTNSYVVGYSGSSTGATSVAIVERVAGNPAVQVVRQDNEWYFVIGFDATWLEQAFANEDAAAVYFKVYSEHPIYRTGGSFNNSWYKTAEGNLERVSWSFMGAPSKTDGYFLARVSRTGYNNWLKAKGDVVSDMYLSIGFSQEDGNMVEPGDTYIDDVMVLIDKTAAHIVGYSGSSSGDTTVNAVERIPGDFAVQVSKSDGEYYNVFGIDATWLAEAFADESIVAVYFKVYSEHPRYRTGGSYGNCWYKDETGALQRTSFQFMPETSKTDGYFHCRVSRTGYNNWLKAKGDVVSDLYLSIGFYGEGNTTVTADNFYIDDLAPSKTML